jgi:hypothetical protein
MEFVIVLVVLAAAVVFVSAPFRQVRIAGATASPDVVELEAARDAKYRELRDAELDHRTGKLSDADYEALDGSLRAEAIEILHRLDTITGR